jgi:hypothetical protein
MYHQAFLDRCYDDIDEMEVKMKKAAHNLDLYNTLLSKSIVHSDYQDTRTLSMFIYFLETGGPTTFRMYESLRGRKTLG